MRALFPITHILYVDMQANTHFRFIPKHLTLTLLWRKVSTKVVRTREKSERNCPHKGYDKEEMNQYTDSLNYIEATIICLIIHGCLSCSYTHYFSSPLCVIWSHESHLSPVSVTVWVDTILCSLPSLVVSNNDDTSDLHVPVCPPGPANQSELELLCGGNPVKTLIKRLESPMGTLVEWDGILITSSETLRQKQLVCVCDHVCVWRSLCALVCMCVCLSRDRLNRDSKVITVPHHGSITTLFSRHAPFPTSCLSFTFLSLLRVSNGHKIIDFLSSDMVSGCGQIQLITSRVSMSYISLHVLSCLIYLHNEKKTERMTHKTF